MIPNVEKKCHETSQCLTKWAQISHKTEMKLASDLADKGSDGNIAHLAFDGSSVFQKNWDRSMF